jgi:hypothetical protein
MLRTTLQRKKHALSKLERDLDVWVATASDEGKAHLIPLSLHWDGARVIVTTPLDSVTTRHVLKSHQARLALGDMRDVVLLDVLAEVEAVSGHDDVSDSFKARNGWDPRDSSREYVYLLMMPQRVLVWESEEELEGRDVMKQGKWLA